MYCSDAMWAIKRLESLAIRLIVQKFVEANNKVSMNISYYCPFSGESTRWIPYHKGQIIRKVYPCHVMTHHNLKKKQLQPSDLITDKRPRCPYIMVRPLCLSLNVSHCFHSGLLVNRWPRARLQYLQWRYCSLALSHRNILPCSPPVSQTWVL